MAARNTPTGGPLGRFPDRPEPTLHAAIVETIRTMHMSPRTEDSYLHWIGRFIRFNDGRHPRSSMRATSGVS